jgi:hypothetical protein
MNIKLSPCFGDTAIRLMRLFADADLQWKHQTEIVIADSFKIIYLDVVLGFRPLSM